MRLLPLLALAACLGPWKDEWDTNAETDTDTDTDADTDTDTDADTDTDTDADTDSDADTDTDPTNVIQVSGDITLPTVWTADNVYILNGFVFVDAGAVLTIQAGTEIRAASGAALIVTRNGRLQAQGTLAAPIVFTSNAPVGSRAAGDWAGVALLGNAPLWNSASKQLEGIDAADLRGQYGGTADDHNCGALSFVRIEFVGYEIAVGNELNGLTLGGCGSQTSVNNVQVHDTLDDGVEIFGGNVDIRNVLISQPGDDGLDWDEGWVGRGQFIVVQQDSQTRAGALPDKAIEADGKFTGGATHPTLYNVTLIGSDDAANAPGQRGMDLRENTEGTLANVLVMGFTREGVEIRDENSSDPPSVATDPTQRTSTNALDGDLSIRSSLFFQIGATADVWAPSEPTETLPIWDTDTPETGDTAGETVQSGDDDNQFDELAWLMTPAFGNVFGQDPLLAAPFDLLAPDFTPAVGSPAGVGAAPVPDDGWFNLTGSGFIGAVAPGGTPFYAGWAAFPEN